MTADGLRFTSDSSTLPEVLNLLVACDTHFVPSLSQRVDLPVYAAKLVDRARRIEAWHGSDLVGLVAAYANAPDQTWFVTNVSVHPAFVRRGIATSLLGELLKNAGSSAVRLEVSRHNVVARALYEPMGFVVDSEAGDILTLIRSRSSQSQSTEFTMRNHDREYQDNAGRKYTYDFDAVIRRYLLQTLSPHFVVGGNVLELGCYKGDMTSQILDYFPTVEAVEAAHEPAEITRQRFPGKVTVHTGTFESVVLDGQFDNVFLIHTLEHLDQPLEVLRRIRGWLSPRGRLFIAVPNANALSRQIAVHMSLIEHNSAVTPAEAKHGHRRTYSLDLLLAHARSSGYAVADFGGVIVKPLANYQFDKALAEGIVDDAYVGACHALAKIYPDLSATVYAICRDAGTAVA